MEPSRVLLRVRGGRGSETQTTDALPSRLETLSRRQHDVLLVLSVRLVVIALVALNFVAAVIAAARDNVDDVARLWMMEPPGTNLDLVLYGCLFSACLLSLASLLRCYCSCCRSGATEASVGLAFLSPEAFWAQAAVLLWLVAAALYVADGLTCAQSVPGHGVHGEHTQAAHMRLFAFRSFTFRIATCVEFFAGQWVWLAATVVLRQSGRPCRQVAMALVCIAILGLSMLVLWPPEGRWPAVCRRKPPRTAYWFFLGYGSRIWLLLVWCVDRTISWRPCAVCGPGCCPTEFCIGNHGDACGATPGRPRRRLLLYCLLCRREFAIVMAFPLGYPFIAFGSSVSLVRGLLTVLVAALLRPQTPLRSATGEYRQGPDLEAEASSDFDIGRALRLLDLANEAYMPLPDNTSSHAVRSWRAFEQRIWDESTDTHCLVVEERGALGPDYKLQGEQSTNGAETDVDTVSGDGLGPEHSTESVLIISFRGTVSWQNVSTDLQMWRPRVLARRGRARYLEESGGGRFPTGNVNNEFDDDGRGAGSSRPHPLLVSERIAQSDPPLLTQVRLSLGQMPFGRGMRADRLRPLHSSLVGNGRESMTRSVEGEAGEDLQAFDLLALARCFDDQLQATFRRTPSQAISPLTIRSAARSDRDGTTSEPNWGRSWCRRWRACAYRVFTFVLQCFCFRLPVRDEDASFVDPFSLQDGELARARAHRGFLDAYLSVRQELLSVVRRRIAKARRENRKFSIYATGHSLGGALATLALLDLRIVLQDDYQLPDVGGSLGPGSSGGTGDTSGAALATAANRRTPISIALYTFGAPRPGNSAFRTVFNVLAPREAFRVVAGRDCFTVMPQKVLGFRQIAREVWLDSCGEMAICMSWAMRQLLPKRHRVIDHLIVEYHTLLASKFARDKGWRYASPWAGAAAGAVFA